MSFPRFRKCQRFISLQNSAYTFHRQFSFQKYITPSHKHRGSNMIHQMDGLPGQICCSSYTTRSRSISACISRQDSSVLWRHSVGQYSLLIPKNNCGKLNEYCYSTAAKPQILNFPTKRKKNKTIEVNTSIEKLEMAQLRKDVRFLFKKRLQRQAQNTKRRVVNRHSFNYLPPRSHSNFFSSPVDGFFLTRDETIISEIIKKDTKEHEEYLQKLSKETFKEENNVVDFAKKFLYLNMHNESANEIADDTKLKKVLKRQYDENLENKKKELRLKQLKTLKETKTKYQMETEIKESSGSQNMKINYQQLVNLAFVDACCFTGNENLALRNMVHKMSQNNKFASSVSAINVLISAFAKKKNLHSLQSLLNIIRKKKLVPTHQTFAGYLEFCGRMDQIDTGLVSGILAEMEYLNLDIKDIAIKCSYKLDEWDYVYKAIQSVKPDFIPNSSVVDLNYTGDLLKPLTGGEQKFKSRYLGNFTKEDLMERLKKQMEIEKSLSIPVEGAFNINVEKGKLRKRRHLCNQTEAMWKKDLLKAFSKKLTSYKKSAHDSLNLTIYPFLKLFPPEQYVEIIFHFLRELVRGSNSYSASHYSHKLRLGLDVYSQFGPAYLAHYKLDTKIYNMYSEYIDLMMEGKLHAGNCRLLWKEVCSRNFDTMNLDVSLKKWPIDVLIGIGKVLFDLVLHDLKININILKSDKHPEWLVPAFSTVYRRDVAVNKTKAEILTHPVVSELFYNERMKTIHFEPSAVPMVVPPLPWTSPKKGALFLESVEFIRYVNSLVLDAVRFEVEEDSYPAVLDSLNNLGNCAWRINKPILDLQLHILNNKGDMKLKIPHSAADGPDLPKIYKNMPRNEKARLYTERNQLKQEAQEMYSLWCMEIYKLSIANKFRDETFWFPHSMDFRGRTYPVSPYFSHISNDNMRGLLLFAEGKPLGDNGHDWLKIHLINLTDFKKRSSNAERLEYANSVMDEVLDSAKNPLDGRGWWKTSAHPWQTLACCIELAKIEEFTGDKRNYISHFPVHQDGSCNGLQHYAALGCDPDGAKSVNLYPCDVPQDVYSDVVELVEKVRQKDAQDGVEIAVILEGQIQRKTIKQTIMTTVYGVTFYGARLQIQKQLKDLPTVPRNKLAPASSYLVTKTFECLTKMFTSTRHIQDWLTRSAYNLSKLHCVEWRTPLGFRIIQPYLQKVKNKNEKGYRTFPQRGKQKNAFPPNYIHSLDSTHMMLTCLQCQRENVTFVSVHDCFWTHSADVETMNRICREQFIAMHSQPLLENLSEDMTTTLMKSIDDPVSGANISETQQAIICDIVKSIPPKGTFELSNVLKSTYFFS